MDIFYFYYFLALSFSGALSLNQEEPNRGTSNNGMSEKNPNEVAISVRPLPYY